MSDSPFAGAWRANPALSERHPANPFRSADVHFQVDGQKVTISHRMVDDQGRQDHASQTIVADGTEHVMPRSSGYALRASWQGPRVLETVARRDGQDEGWGRYEVSEDGSRMTITAPEQRIVLERV